MGGLQRRVRSGLSSTESLRQRLLAIRAPGPGMSSSGPSMSSTSSLGGNRSGKTSYTTLPSIAQSQPLGADTGGETADILAIRERLNNIRISSSKPVASPGGTLNETVSSDIA